MAWSELAMIDVPLFVESGAPWRAFAVTGTPHQCAQYAVDLDVLRAAGWTIELTG